MVFPAGERPGDGIERRRLIERARWLAWLGLAWHGFEAVVAIGAGVAASSVALIGFGADSLVEGIAGLIVLWRFADARHRSETAERRAQQLIAGSFILIALYISFDAGRTLIAGDHPATSWVGIGLSVVTLLTMPALARAKTRVAEQLHSSSLASEGRQNRLCAYLSAGLLVGLVANAALGWWLADPIVALGIALVAVREARQAWRGEACACCAPGVVELHTAA
jgi:divalent metal cation (Fe/Co/Zn/Cd) transporter